MHADEFNEIAEARIAHCRSILIVKGKEYSRDGDRLHNFKTAAAIDGETPEQALWGMAKKHVVSVRDMVNDIERGIVPSRKMLDEKITDWINYGLLLEGLVEERRRALAPPQEVEAAAVSCDRAHLPSEALVNLCCRQNIPTGRTSV